jgi:hypothetical protein
MLDKQFLEIFGSPFLRILSIALNPLSKESHSFEIWLHERFTELVTVMLSSMPHTDDLPSVSGKGGLKYDSGKPKVFPGYNLMLEAAHKGFLHGKKKYGEYAQFKHGLAPERIINSYYRHLLQSQGTHTELDSESGLPHLYHAASCLLMLAVISEQHVNETGKH